MRPLVIGVVLLGLLSVARGEGAIVAQPCLSSREMQEIVAANRVVPPALAVGQARRAVPGADMLRASMCRDGEAIVYVISLLRKDGRVVHVVIDGPSGRVAQVH
jgi:uncharacterized membrane protein YkoI